MHGPPADIDPLSLHDALPISGLDIITDGEIRRESYSNRFATALEGVDIDNPGTAQWRNRSEEHTSELQSRLHLVCRLLLEKKNDGKLKITLPPIASDSAHDIV